MEHGHLVEKYNKAQHHFNKKKYRKAKRLFESISTEIYASDTDCMADLNLCDASQNYLDEIDMLHTDKNILLWILTIVLLGILVAYTF
jgi:hypothetical protein